MGIADFSNTLYADDSFLVGKHAKELKKILWAIEKHSARYGMELKKKKCVYINMNNKNKIKFSDGNAMVEEKEATYLGANITTKNLNKAEVDKRVNKALSTCNKLKVFVKKARCNKRWKLQVYNAVVISQLVYGLETLYLSSSLIKRLDAFHIRGIRHIMGIEHSYWSRTSNEEILFKANWLVGWRQRYR